MYRLTKLLVIFILTCAACSNGFCQQNDTLISEDYLIKYSEINFHLNDSVYPFTLFIHHDGHFYFREGFGDSAHLDLYTGMFYTAEGAYKYVYEQIDEKALDIESFFPLFMYNDSAFINEYSHKYRPFNHVYELEYSFILKNLEEPSLFYGEDKRVIRIIFPAEGIETPGKYYTVKVEFNEGKATFLICVEGDFKSSINYEILKRTSCPIKEKRHLEIEELIKELPFDEEKNFTVANLDPKFFIEYRNGNKYYAFRKSSHYGGGRRKDEYRALYSKLYGLALDCMRKN